MKTMRSLCLCLIVVLLLASIVGCQKKETYTAATYTAYMTSTSDSAIGVSADELPWSPADVHERSTETITYEGKEYTGTFKRGRQQLPDFRVKLEYTGEEADFTIDGQTGDLIGFTDKKAGSFDKVATAEQARQAADALAEKYVPLSEYTVKEGNAEGPLRTYRYVRVINDETTSDFVYVVVDGQGQVYSFEKGEIGSFANVTSVTIDEAQVKTAIENKLNACYTAEFQCQWQSYETYHRELVRLPDGNIGLYCSLIVQFVPREDAATGETIVSGDSCEILIATTPA